MAQPCNAPLSSLTFESQASPLAALSLSCLTFWLAFLWKLMTHPQPKSSSSCCTMTILPGCKKGMQYLGWTMNACRYKNNKEQENVHTSKFYACPLHITNTSDITKIPLHKPCVELRVSWLQHTYQHTYQHTVVLEIFAVVNDSWLKETAKIKNSKI